MRFLRTLLNCCRAGEPAQAGPAAAAVVLALMLVVAGSARAAEFRLRPRCHSRGPLVTLGDVAQIVSNDSQRADTLAAIELFPAPADSRRRFVAVREIQDLLRLRGVNLTEHRISGASEVEILGGDGEPVATVVQRPLSASVKRKARRLVTQAVSQYLKEYVSGETSWTVEIELSDGQVRTLAAPGHQVVVTGGVAPYTGQQRFEVTVATPDEPIRFSVDARVSTAPAVVVAVRSLPRGTLIGPADVRLQREARRDAGAQGFGSLAEVIGKETVQAVAEGKPLRRNAIRAPLLVRRGDVVTVCARSPGICVRTNARARQSGSLGELVSVESLADRRTFLARVAKLREVEIYARAVKADSGDSSKRPPRTSDRR